MVGRRTAAYKIEPEAGNILPDPFGDRDVLFQHVRKPFAGRDLKDAVKLGFSQIRIDQNDPEMVLMERR